MERQIFGDGVGLDPALILALCLTTVQSSTFLFVGWAVLLRWKLHHYSQRYLEPVFETLSHSSKICQRSMIQSSNI